MKDSDEIEPDDNLTQLTRQPQGWVSHFDIIRVRADPDRAPGEELLSGGYIVEAVVTKDRLAKLKKMGFEVSEIPEKN